MHDGICGKEKKLINKTVIFILLSSSSSFFFSYSLSIHFTILAQQTQTDRNDKIDENNPNRMKIASSSSSSTSKAVIKKKESNKI